jgi:hypothetical protein
MRSTKTPPVSVSLNALNTQTNRVSRPHWPCEHARDRARDARADDEGHEGVQDAYHVLAVHRQPLIQLPRGEQEWQL